FWIVWHCSGVMPVDFMPSRVADGERRKRASACDALDHDLMPLRGAIAQFEFFSVTRPLARIRWSGRPTNRLARLSANHRRLAFNCRWASLSVNGCPAFESALLQRPA